MFEPLISNNLLPNQLQNKPNLYSTWAYLQAILPLTLSYFNWFWYSYNCSTLLKEQLLHFNNFNLRRVCSLVFCVCCDGIGNNMGELNVMFSDAVFSTYWVLWSFMILPLLFSCAFEFHPACFSHPLFFLCCMCKSCTS